MVLRLDAYWPEGSVDLRDAFNRLTSPLWGTCDIKEISCHEPEHSELAAAQRENLRLREHVQRLELEARQIELTGTRGHTWSADR